MQNFKYDVVVLGAGPGGYVAAIRAAQLGLKTAIIEKEKLGGICLNWGCIPTKALLRTAEILNNIKKSNDFGIKIKGYEIDFSRIINRSREISSKLSNGIKYLLNNNKVEVIKGHGRFESKNSIKVIQNSESIYINAKNFIIATGARPKFIKGLSPQDSPIIMGYKEALMPEKLPKKTLIIGGGAIGVEFASFYNALGSKVTLIEVADRILVNEDKEVSEFSRQSLEKQGIKIFTSARIINFSIYDNNIKFDIESSNFIHTDSYDNVISAIGIISNIEDIGLENINIKVTNGDRIAVEDDLRTSVDNIYAIGDVTSAPWLAHKASHEGVIASENIKGYKTHKIDLNNIPGCIYSHPQIASVGLTENKAEIQYGKHNIAVGKFPLSASGKALALGESEGFVKTIFCKKTGELLGAHMIGPEVTEMIHSLVLIKVLEGTELDLMKVMFPHPTISEAIHESVLNAFQRAIHI